MKIMSFQIFALAIAFSLFNTVPAVGQIITTIAGIGPTGPIGSYSGDGGPATLAGLNLPKFVTIDTTGNIFISDMENYRIRKINTSGIITTYGGTGLFGTTGNGGPATSAKIALSGSITHDNKGNIYFVDYLQIRSINASGIINTIAGTGILGNTGDGGPATNAEINPAALACDRKGNVYLSVAGYIRKVDTTGIITTIAGNGTVGVSGDGGPATAASISADHMAIDTAGNIYILSVNLYVARKINTSGKITRVAGTGISGYSGDGGQATNATIASDLGIATDLQGNIYLSETQNSVIRKITLNGVINTIAGNGIEGFSGDGGAATEAEFTSAEGIAIAKNNDIIIADAYNNRIRKVAHSPTGVPEPARVAAEVVLAPNPAPTGRFSVRLPAGVGMASMVITNTTSQTVLRQSLPPGKTSPIILNAPPGLYFVTITTPGNRWVEKVVVE